MGDYGLATTWGGSKPGREQTGMALWGDAFAWAEKAKANGQIDEVTVQIFAPTAGGIPNGIFTVWGTEEQILAIQVDEERRVLTQRSALCNYDVAEALCTRGDAVAEGVGQYAALLEGL